MNSGLLKKISRLWREKKSRVILLIGFLGIALILASGFFTDNRSGKTEAETEAAVPDAADEYRKKLEQELAAIISRIDGAGEVSILITMETTTEDVYVVEKKTEEKNSHSSSDDGETGDGEYREENKYVTVKRKDGSEDAVLQKQIMPKIRGVLVVCDGGGNSVVKEKITQAVSGVLNISGGKVVVTN